MIRIIVIKVVDRIKEAGNTQETLTKHASVIRARLGFHELNEETCSREAFIVLLLRDDQQGYKKLIDDLQIIRGLEIRDITSSSVVDPVSVVASGSPVVTIATLIIENRTEVASEMQDILSRYGCSIRTRLGLNEVIDGQETGIIVLELYGDPVEQNNLLRRLSSSVNIRLSAVSFI